MGQLAKWASSGLEVKLHVAAEPLNSPYLSKHDREPVVDFSQKGFSLSSLGYCKKHGGLHEMTPSWCKYKVFKYKWPILG